MNRLVTIGSTDCEAAGEITERALQLLESKRLVSPADLREPEKQRQELAHRCLHASDAVTRAAHDVGILASREVHGVRLPEDRSYVTMHSLTSLAPLDQLPGEYDLILCLTWGQFTDSATSRKHPLGFFGHRREIAALIDERYDIAYGTGSVLMRQVTHTPPKELREQSSVTWMPPDVWLATTPEGLAYGDYPIGEVPSDAFPRWQWEIPERI